MWEVIQSAGGMIYYLDKNFEPKFLLIKRHALSGKIEWIAPKGKIQAWEKPIESAVREASEETGIPINKLIPREELWVVSLRSNPDEWNLNKDITYFLMKYTGDPSSVKIDQVEWYVWVYKRADLSEVLALVYYKNIRELFRKAFIVIKSKQKDDTIKKSFLDKLK